MLKRSAGLEMRSPDLQKGMVLPSPAEPRKIKQHPRLFGFFRAIRPPQSPARVGAVEDETADTFRMAGSILYGDWATPARSQQIKLSDGCCVDNAFEIVNPILK